MAAPAPITPEAPPLTGPILMNQDWRDLTFLHWAVEPQRVAHLMPPGVRPDTLDGTTYVGLVPFRMVDLAPGPGRRRLPWLGGFLETNVRLYSVDEAGTRGVVFLSLDTDRLAIVAGARVCFGVPYRFARMSFVQTEYAEGAGVVDYRARLRRPGPAVTSRVRVRVGARRDPTELDHFVSARWGLHTRLYGGTRYVPNRHEPWPLHDAALLEIDDGLVGSVADGVLAGLTDRPPDHLAFSPGVHTEFGLARTVRSTTSVN